MVATWLHEAERERERERDLMDTHKCVDLHLHVLHVACMYMYIVQCTLYIIYTCVHACQGYMYVTKVQGVKNVVAMYIHVHVHVYR